MIPGEMLGGAAINANLLSVDELAIFAENLGPLLLVASHGAFGDDLGVLVVDESRTVFT